MGGTSAERYAVVSCHVERPLDDRAWARFSELQARRPQGFAIAALLRPADTGAGEDEDRWLERAREAAAHGPLGHHTHWTAPDHARPIGPGTAERVLAEGARLRELGLAPTLFCGGGWYTDAAVADACAELGYADCTPRATRPRYLAAGEPWASLAEPAWVRLPSGRLLQAIPTTHSLGELARTIFRWDRPGRMPRRVTPRSHGTLPPVIHAYFHDTDLLDRRRRAALPLLLRALALRATPTDLDALARDFAENMPELAWDDVARL
jgi:hypothetical protein